MFKRRAPSHLNPTLVMKVQEALSFDTGLQSAETNRKRLRKLRVRRNGLAAAIEIVAANPWSPLAPRSELTIEEEEREREPIRLFGR